MEDIKDVNTLSLNRQKTNLKRILSAQLDGKYIARAVEPRSMVGRNDICTCGSGIKYKKCCLN